MSNFFRTCTIFIKATLFFLIVSCSQNVKESSPIKLYKKISFPISPRDPIVDIMSTATMQLVEKKITLNYIDKRTQDLVTLYLLEKKKEKVQFKTEGPNALGIIPDYFYLNAKKERVIGGAAGIVLCESHGILKTKEKFIPKGRVLTQFLSGIRSGLQQQSKLIFFNYEGSKFNSLLVFDIEKFNQQEINIPYQKEIFDGLNSESSLSINCTLPFVTMDENTFIFSSWYSNSVYEWNKSTGYVEKKFELNNSKNPSNTFLNSWQEAILELGFTSHSPVIKIGSRELYISENYNGETKKAELLNLNADGKAIFRLDVSNTQRFWVENMLVKFFIDEEKNKIDFEIWE